MKTTAELLFALVALVELAVPTGADDLPKAGSPVGAPSNVSSTAGGASTADSLDPSNAVSQLAVHPDLAVGLFAAEPLLTNPASIDVDELGRVWVCEAINYRAFRNADVIADHKDGDRILVLEDSNGDSQADKSTVFYQGHDVDSAHGVLVMPAPDGKGTRAIVSALDCVFFLIDDDGDLKADRKELLFTGIDGVQHDHGIHAFHFGPDGKLYFNFGNAGMHIKDKAGRPIIDKMGREVNDARRPYQQGMVFRCNVDGSEFETLAWNFRNNWEVCVDSFGTMWQSDNDDDGNQACRINYVMEYGNFGYMDEATGAAWTEPRTNWETEIPRRHWHLNDPGVIPNVLQIGAGAPAGICVYEGDLLPERFRNALIHTDPGKNVCRAYAVKPDGAGYTAESVDVLDGSRDKWFRPCDVCVAPDGSLLVADWCDPGVGGHRMEDVGRGRIFRVTPKGEAEQRYKAPAIDLATPEGAVSALKSPNMATRYLAWTTLHNFGAKAEPALREMQESDNPVFQARALWALGKLEGSEIKSAAVIEDALQDANSDLRVVGIRLARQLIPQLSFATLQGALDIEDPSPAVRREILLGLREIKPEWLPPSDRDNAVPSAWARLAEHYDGDDRWYLEALGIAAQGRWDACMSALQRNEGSNWDLAKRGRDILWRSRGTATSEKIASVISNPNTPAEELPRFFRALDFQQVSNLQQTLLSLAFGDHRGLPHERAALIRSESIARLPNSDLSTNPQYSAALDSVLNECAGSERFVQLVDKFSVAKRYPDLLALSQSQPASQLAADAIAVIYGKSQSNLLRAALFSSDLAVVENTLTAMATAGDARGDDLAVLIIDDDHRPLGVRRLAVKTLGASSSGSERLLEMARQRNYPDQLQDAVAAALSAAPSSSVRAVAASIFPPPPTKDNTPLPPLSELIAMKGDGERGRAVFDTIGTCAKCHQPHSDAKDVGPDLSEIGDKLAREAMFESILYPSAAISHNFESTLILTEDGLTHTGILVSETAVEVKLKDENGIVRSIPVAAIEERSKSDLSLMPSDIHKLLSAQELVDVVDYLSMLKAKK